MFETKQMRALQNALPQRKMCAACVKAEGRKSKRTASRGRGPQRHVGMLTRGVVAAAHGQEAGGWGDRRPELRDTCLDADQDAAGPLTDLDAEWQAFLAANGRLKQPQPLIWAGDSDSSRQLYASSSSSDISNSSRPPVEDAPTTSNRGPEASHSKRYSSSIQSFDDWDFAEDDYPITVPCNLPLNETMHSAAAASTSSCASLGGNLEQLGWPAIGQLLPSVASADLCAPGDLLTTRSLLQSLREVYVLLFGVGQKDTEGIYSLRAVSDDGFPTETIIAFENMEDAVRYSALLEATMEHCPHVCSISPTELMSFCSDSGYRCRLELEGSLLMPPDYNVHITDWERSLRLREGKFHVLPEEPDMVHPASSRQPAAAAHLHSNFLPEAAASSSGIYRSQHAREFTESELNTLKAQLEALLPGSSPLSSQDGQ